uniref:BHLH domain-containing protein n=1 Tax=Mesocestoides corti TaxID=53468 RepID=A0A5K3ER55_MESCO
MFPNRRVPPPRYCPGIYPQSTLPTPIRHPYQPLYVIPISAATTPVEPIIVDLSSGTANSSRPAQVAIPNIAPKIENQASNSSEPARGRKPLLPVDDREMKRRVKKQNMERRRRACISDKLSALHSLAVSLVGEKPHQQTQQRTEITDILNQCVNVLQGLSDFVKSEPELQAKMHRLGVPLKEPDQHSKAASTSKVAKDEDDQENVPARSSAFTPVGSHRMSTSTPLAPRPVLLTEDLPTFRQKRESTDSGYCWLTSPPEHTPSSSSLNTEENRSHKRPRQSSPTLLWRPYLD